MMIFYDADSGEVVGRVDGFDAPSGIKVKPGGSRNIGTIEIGTDSPYYELARALDRPDSHMSTDNFEVAETAKNVVLYGSGRYFFPKVEK